MTELFTVSERERPSDGTLGSIGESAFQPFVSIFPFFGSLPRARDHSREGRDIDQKEGHIVSDSMIIGHGDSNRNIEIYVNA